MPQVRNEPQLSTRRTARQPGVHMAGNSLDFPLLHAFISPLPRQVLAGERPPIPKHEWPELVVSLIQQCWDQDPARRPPIGDVLSQLQAWRPHVSAVSALSGAGSGDALDSLLFK